MTSVILVQFNQVHLTLEAIASFRRHHKEGCEFVVVDNGSTECGIDKLTQTFPEITLVRNRTNKGFGSANNEGASVAKGDLLLFLNNDTITDRPLLPVAEGEFAREGNVGIVGPGLRYPDGSFQLSAGALPTIGQELIDKSVYRLLEPLSLWRNLAGRSASGRNVGWVTGAAMFIRRDLFMELGGFDEEYFMYFEDKDLCLRVLRSGSEVRYLPTISLVHLKAGSSAAEGSLTAQEYRRSQMLYYRKHRPAWEQKMLAMYLRSSHKLPG